jgi:hypothetical protein
MVEMHVVSVEGIVGDGAILLMPPLVELNWQRLIRIQSRTYTWMLEALTFAIQR